MSEPPPYWFHAKRYGLGWGLPARRKGWIVLGSWLIAVTVGSVWLAPRRPPAFVGFVLLMSALLIAVCYLKGDPAGRRWRWGE